MEALASFYPMEFVVERVGAEHVSVASLTPAGADPHNLELSPAQVATIDAADLVVYVSGLQPAADEAVAQTTPEHVVDAADVVGPAEIGRDPHFWLDPTLLADLSDAVGAELSEVDPENAESYEANAQQLRADLEALDDAYRHGLAACAGATLVTSHTAFGYLADRYDLDQVGITGIDPEAEPSPARLREVMAVIEETGVRTIYFEVIAGAAVAQTLADQLGVGTAVLDPLEGQTEPEHDYLDVMYANLEALTDGLVCEG